MNKVELQDLVGGALQETFEKAFAKVIDNLQDVNTAFKPKRGITIKLDFAQNESRDDVKVEISVTEKLAPQCGLSTNFSIARDLRTGELHAEEYGRYIKGQVTVQDYEKTQIVGEEVVDTETGEIVTDTVVDFRKAAMN